MPRHDPTKPPGLFQYLDDDPGATPWWLRTPERGQNPARRTLMERAKGVADTVGEQTLGKALTLLTTDPSKPETQKAYRSALGLGADFTPVVGDIKAVFHDAPRLFKEGHPIWGSVTLASGMLPIVPSPAGMLARQRARAARRANLPQPKVQRVERSEAGGPGGVFTYDMGEGNLVEIDVGMGTGERANELQINWAGSPSNQMTRLGANRVGPGDIGPRQMRAMLEDVVDQFPEATHVRFDRITGASMEAGQASREVVKPIPGRAAPPETVTAATVKVGDRVVSGRTHGEAFMRLTPEEQDIYARMTPEEAQAAEGFSTSSRPHISREEASDIAYAANQIGRSILSDFEYAGKTKPQYLHAEDVVGRFSDVEAGPSAPPRPMGERIPSPDPDEPLWLNYDRPVSRPGENIFAIDKRKLDEAALDLPGVGSSRRYPTYRGEVPEDAWVRMGVSGTDQMGPEQVMEAMRQLDIPGPRTMDEWNAALDAGQNPREGLLWHVSPEEAMRAPTPRIFNAIREQGDLFQREHVEDLLHTDPDAAARIGYDLDIDVTDADMQQARQYLSAVNAAARQRLPETMTVYRSGEGLDDDLVEVTLDRNVAQRFADKRGSEVREFQINRDDVLLDVEGVGDQIKLPSAYMEKGLLVRGERLASTDDLPLVEGTEQFAKPRGQEWSISQGDLDMVGSYDPATRTIRVGNVQGGDVGATALRGAIRQLQLKYPHATSIEGVRTTGGRGKEVSRTLQPRDAGFEPEFLAESYPTSAEPVLKPKEKKPGETYWSRGTDEPNEAFWNLRKEIQADIEAGNYTPYFDPDQRYYASQVGEVQQRGDVAEISSRATKPQELQAQLGDSNVQDLLARAYRDGSGDPNAKMWYAMGQLEDAAIAELGEEAGRKWFREDFADLMAATTAGQDPTSNLMMTAYVSHLKQAGEAAPEIAANIPKPVMGQYMGGNVEAGMKLTQEGLDAITQPKGFSFSSNFLGDLSKPTVDKQMMEIFSEALGQKLAAPPAPRSGGYRVFRDEVIEAARRAGIEPERAAEFQDVAWAGVKGRKDAIKALGKDATEDEILAWMQRNPVGKPMITHVNEAIERTARLTNQSPDEVVRAWMRGAPLYGVAAAMGVRSARDRYEENR